MMLLRVRVQLRTLRRGAKSVRSIVVVVLITV